MTPDELRFFRLGSASIPEPASARPRGGTPRFLGRVIDGGALPTVADRYVLMRPCRLDGPEAEGSGAAIATDVSRASLVYWLGPERPQIGDLAVAHHVAGRWIAEKQAVSTTVACAGCILPKSTLTFTWTNILLGTRTSPMVFNGTDEWATACVNQIIFRLRCVAGQLVFSATYFSGAPCPTGTPATCSSAGANPFGLTPTIQSCAPLLLQYNVTGCPALVSQGFTRFAVTL